MKSEGCKTKKKHHLSALPNWRGGGVLCGHRTGKLLKKHKETIHRCPRKKTTYCSSAIRATRTCAYQCTFSTAFFLTNKRTKNKAHQINEKALLQNTCDNICFTFAAGRMPGKERNKRKKNSRGDCKQLTLKCHWQAANVLRGGVVRETKTSRESQSTMVAHKYFAEPKYSHSMPERRRRWRRQRRR